MTVPKMLKSIHAADASCFIEEDGAEASLLFHEPDGTPVAVSMRRLTLEMLHRQIAQQLAAVPSPIARG